MVKPLNQNTVESHPSYPERIVQFGGGNFLRAFVDWIVEILNQETGFDSGVVLVKATPGQYEALDAQDGLYHTVLRGIQAGDLVEEHQLITCVQRTLYPYDDFDDYLALARQLDIRFIFSNTTEAGITFVDTDKQHDMPPSSFPAKLTLFLYERFQHFGGEDDKGCIIIPTELIVDNGSRLRESVLQYADLWELGESFARWVSDHNLFCNTLVDRIVTGFPESDADEINQTLGYEDKLLVAGEIYHSWIIEAPQSLLDEFPIDKTKTPLNIKIVDDASPYRTIKVRLLNGAHTTMVPIGYLLRLESVHEAIEHPNLSKFINSLLHHEVIPSIDDIASDELEQFVSDVIDRFCNPHIHHRLLAIALNSTSKFKERLLPSLLAYHEKTGEHPDRIVLALSALIRFYKGEWQGTSIPLNDDAEVLDWFKQQWQNANSVDELVASVLCNEAVWGADLSEIGGLIEKVSDYIKCIDNHQLLDMIQALE